MNFLKKTNFGKWVSVIPGKKIQTTFQVWIYFPEMTLTHFPKNIFFKNSWPYIQEKSLDFFSRNDAYSFPKKRFLEFWLDFFPRMTLTHFPTFGFFFQDSRIGVKDKDGQVPKEKPNWTFGFLISVFLGFKWYFLVLSANFTKWKTENCKEPRFWFISKIAHDDSSR